MGLTVEKSGNITIATLPPVRKLTSAPPVEEIRLKLEALLASDDTKALIIDLADVEYGGTRILSMLVMVHIRAKKLKKRIKFCNLSEFIADGLSKTHLNEILDTYDTLEEAMIHFII